MKPTLFISDLHLSAARPAMVDAFERFCAGQAREATELYVLGDLFDTWVGDEQLSRPDGRGRRRGTGRRRRGGHGGRRDARQPRPPARRALRRGVRCDAAARTRSSPTSPATRTLLLHGDTLCTDDAGYQRYRARVHDPVLQRRFLALP